MTIKIGVKRLPKDPGPSAWNKILADAPSYPELSADCIADWVIIGGGFAGLAAARRLTQLVPDDKVVLLEAIRLADGPAGRNSGFMIDLPHELNSKSYAGGKESDLQQIKLNREAIKFAAEMAEEFEMPSSVFSYSGKVTAASTVKGIKHLDNYSVHLESLGENYKWLDSSDMKSKTGSEFYQRGLYTSGAAMIQPAAFVRMAAQGLADKVSFHENSPVTNIVLGDEHIVETPKAKVRAKNIILAVNGHIQSFGFFEKRLLHVFTYASLTRALTENEVKTLGGEQNWGILPADPMGTTVRRFVGASGESRILIRNHATLNQSLEASSSNMKRAAAMQDVSFEDRFPNLPSVDMEYRWGGRLCLSLNSVPAFGEVEKRVWSACCQNGLGTVKGTLSGMMAAEQAVLGRSPILDEFKQHQEPRLLPPEPFLSFGANATMRWKEWLAGKEI